MQWYQYSDHRQLRRCLLTMISEILTHPAGYAMVPVLGSQAIEALFVDVNPSTLSNVT